MITEPDTRPVDALNVVLWVLAPLAWLTLLGIFAWSMLA